MSSCIEASRPRIHLGMNSCFAVKRWPEPKEWLSVLVHELDLSVAQLSLDLLPPSFTHGPAEEYVSRLRQSADDLDVEIHSLFTGLGAYSSNLLLSNSESAREAAMSWYESIIDLTAMAGARGAGGHVGAYSVPSFANAELRSTLLTGQLAAMNEIAEYAASRGLDHLQFENLAVEREYGHSIAEAHYLEDALQGSAIPWVLCLDVGHPAALGAGHPDHDLDAWLKQPWRNTPVLQLQQSVTGSDRHGAFTEATASEGAIDPQIVVDRIRQWDATDVYLFFEILHPHEMDDQQMLRELKASVDLWRDALKR